MRTSLIILWTLLGTTAGAADDATLTIHLPRTVTLENGDVTVGQIGIVYGPLALSEQVQALSLGRLFTPDQELIFTREQILSRLASCGVPGTRIHLTGAQEVQVRRSATCVKADEIVTLARRYLEKHMGSYQGLIIEALRRPKDMYLVDAGDRVRLVSRAVSRGSLSQVRVRVSALVDGKEQDFREILFRLQYPHRLAITTQDLAAGEVLTDERLKIETQLKSYPEPADWQPPTGLVTQRAVPRGTTLTDKWVQRPVVPVTIKRNQSVVIRIQQPGLSITAMGQALADGCTGEILKVKNMDSRRIILCRVQEDGSVGPVL